jgi:hypothetical protein
MHEPRKIDESAWSRFDALIADEKRQVTFDDIENFVSVVMDVHRGSYAVRVYLIESADQAARSIAGCEYSPQAPEHLVAWSLGPLDLVRSRAFVNAHLFLFRSTVIISDSLKSPSAPRVRRRSSIGLDPAFHAFHLRRL